MPTRILLGALCVVSSLYPVHASNAARTRKEKASLASHWFIGSIVRVGNVRSAFPTAAFTIGRNNPGPTHVRPARVSFFERNPHATNAARWPHCDDTRGCR